MTVKKTVILPNFLCGNFAFSQNFHTRKLGEITVFFAVMPPVPKINILADFSQFQNQLISCYNFRTIMKIEVIKLR